MKKTIFTFCSVIAVSALIFMACQKEDNGNYKVTYANQPGSTGTGGNPNPNGLPSSTGVATTSTTGTVAPTYGSITKSGTTNTFTSSTACGSATMQGNYSGGNVQLQFSAPPTAGTYTTVASGATAGQVVMICYGSTADVGGIITCTGTTTITAAFTSITWGGGTPVTGSLKCQ